MVAVQGHFFGEGEIVLCGILPVDQLDGLRVFIRRHFYLHAVAEQAVDLFVVFVEVAVGVVRLRAQFVESLCNLRRAVAAFGEVGREQFFFDVAVAIAVGPVAEIFVIEFVLKQGDDPVLRGAFRLADGAHITLFPA